MFQAKAAKLEGSCCRIGKVLKLQIKKSCLPRGAASVTHQLVEPLNPTTTTNSAHLICFSILTILLASSRWRYSVALEASVT